MIHKIISVVIIVGLISMEVIMKKESTYLQKSKAYKGYHYTVLEPNMLDYLHKRTLKMLEEVISVFDRNDIRYMICGGTLLGAATTGKFIPWDDDLDVCVFEEDYNRVIDCLINELPEEMMVQCNKTEPNYYLDWIKVRDQKSHVYPDNPLFKENGVWIDIYKLIPTKAKNLNYLIAKGHLDYLNNRYALGGISPEDYNKRMRENNLKQNVLKEKLESSFNNDMREVYVIWSASKIALNKDWVLPLQTISFEELELTSFNKVSAYLSQHYGKDYMNLPPDELRRVGINNITLL
jgi:lipopolysaccharide cholinephosphotransferase